MNSSGSSTVRRAISLLDALIEFPQGAGLSELGRTAGLHHATAHRLLSTMVEAKLVDLHSDTGKYRLGLRMLDFADAVNEGLEVRAVARPMLLWLTRTTGETVHLAALDGAAMAYLDRIDGSHPVALRTRVGFRAPLHVTGVGKAFLANMSESEVDAILDGYVFARHTEHTIVGLDEFKEHLRRVRLQGFAVDDEEHRLTIRCVAAPVFDRGGKVVAAVSVSGPTFRLTHERIGELTHIVRTAALRISSDLGWTSSTVSHKKTPHAAAAAKRVRKP